MKKEPENVYLCTVWHTGTKYFKAGLEREYILSYSHLNKSVLRQVPNYEKVFTTYRDPKRVAASWLNRHKSFKKENLTNKWLEQWGCYKELLKTKPIVLDFTKGREQAGIVFPESPINSHSDDLSMHKALDAGDLDYLYRKIPKELMDIAEDACFGLNCN